MTGDWAAVVAVNVARMVVQASAGQAGEVACAGMLAAGNLARITLLEYEDDVNIVKRRLTQLGDRVVPLDADVRQWQPGDAVVEGAFPVSRNLAPGRYPLRVALLDSSTRLPAVRLAIAGRQDDGWYQVGEIAVD